MNSLLSSLRAAAVAVVFVSVVDGSAVAATNLVTNGGFESGLAGWTESGSTGFIGATPSAPYVASGSLGLFAGPISTFGFISQTFATVAGQTYQLDYFLLNTSGVPNAFQASWGGAPIAGAALNNSGAFSYTGYSFGNLVATSSSTTLTFGFRHDPSFWGLDDVSVVATSSIPGTPDSGSTVALLGLALTLLAGVRRRLA